MDPAISRTTNATKLKSWELLRGILQGLKKFQVDISFHLVTMATAQSPDAFLPFIDETVLKTTIFQILPEFTIIKLKIPNFVKR